MIKSLMKAALFGMIQRWFNPAAPRRPSPVHLDTDELKSTAVRLGSLAVLMFLNFLLFVGSIVVTAVAIAHSFDVYDRFVPSSVFWTGLIMGFSALALTGICGWALTRTKLTVRDFVVMEPELEPSFDLRERFLNPFLEGLAEGFRKEGAPSSVNRTTPAA